MSDRIDEYHGHDAKVLTTDEVERWQEFLGDGIQLRRTLATTRALETAQTALTIAASRSAEEDEARTGYLSLMGKFYEHLELMIRYLEEETSQGDGIAEEHHDGYRAAKALVERTEGLDGLWERAQIAVHELKLELDNALHTFRCIEEDERYQAVVARAEKAETKAAADAMRDWDSLRQEFEANVTTLRARSEKAEAERDEARAEVERRDALISRDGYEDMRQHAADLAQRLETAERERDAARATVAELVTALTGLERKFLDPRPGDPGGPCWCDYDRPRWMGHDDHCDAARDALAKAKGATNGTR